MKPFKKFFVLGGISYLSFEIPFWINNVFRIDFILIPIVVFTLSLIYFQTEYKTLGVVSALAMFLISSFPALLFVAIISFSEGVLEEFWFAIPMVISSVTGFMAGNEILNNLKK